MKLCFATVGDFSVSQATAASLATALLLLHSSSFDMQHLIRSLNGRVENQWYKLLKQICKNGENYQNIL